MLSIAAVILICSVGSLDAFFLPVRQRSSVQRSRPVQTPSPFRQCILSPAEVYLAAADDTAIAKKSSLIGKLLTRKKKEKEMVSSVEAVAVVEKVKVKKSSVATTTDSGDKPAKLKKVVEVEEATTPKPRAKKAAVVEKVEVVEAVKKVTKKAAAAVEVEATKTTTEIATTPKATKTKATPKAADEESYELDDLESFMEEGDKYVPSESSNNNRDRGQSSSSSSSGSSFTPERRGDGGGGFAGKNAEGKNLPDSMVEYCKPEDCLEIQELINQRQEFRYGRQFEMADTVRDTLEREHNVEIYDRRGIWVCADGRRGPLKSTDGTQAVAPVDCPYTVQQVQDMVEMRTSLRRQRDYAGADKIRDDLAASGVELMDKLNDWRSYDGKMYGKQSTDFDEYEDRKYGGRGNY